MTVIEMQTMVAIKTNLPKIANELKRIADEMFFANQFAMNKACERKEIDNDEATVD